MNPIPKDDPGKLTPNSFSLNFLIFFFSFVDFSCSWQASLLGAFHVSKALTVSLLVRVSTSTITAIDPGRKQLRFSVPMVSFSLGKDLVALQVRHLKSK